jgi:hypothetical protein
MIAASLAAALRALLAHPADPAVRAEAQAVLDRYDAKRGRAVRYRDLSKGHG